MSLRGKLVLAQIPLMICLAGVGILAIHSVARLGANSSRIVSDNYRSILAAQRMNESLERINDAVFFLALDETSKAQALQATHRSRFLDELVVEEGNITEPGEEQAARALRSRWLAYTRTYDELVSAPRQEIIHRYFQDLDPKFWELKKAVDGILNINQDAMVRKSEEARQSSSQLNSYTALAAIAAILLGIGASLWFTRRILRPLNALWAAAQQISEGNLDTRVAVVGRDEIAHVAREFNSMADRLQQFRQSSLGELLAAQESAQAAIDSLPDPVMIIDINDQVLNLNQAAAGLVQRAGMAAAEPSLGNLDPALRDAVVRAKAHVLAGKGPFQPRGFEDAVRVAGAEGDRFFLIRAMPFYSSGKGLAGATVILQDVTRLRRFDELKNDLMATVAHEYRTPLTSLHLAIHLCLEGAAGPLTEKQLDLLHAARKDCERLQTVVDDMLDLSRLQAGKVTVHPVPVAPQRLVDAAAEAHQDAGRQRQIRIEREVMPSIAEVLVDVDRIQVVFSNLINNALRHTPAGGTITLRALPAGESVRFEVVDTGEGIAAAHLERIFDRFYRVPGTPGEGAGLGLSIAREVVQVHRGQIGASSSPGAGSTFWFTLPCHSPGGLDG